MIKLEELSTTLNMLSTSLRRSLKEDFRVLDGYTYIVDVFIDHPEHGNAVIVKHTGDNKLYRVPFNEVDNEIKLAKTMEWEEVVIQYKVISQESNSDEVSVDELATISIVESEEGKPLILNMRLIETGFGNKRNNHYYSEKLLQESASQFVGVKMYVTEHRLNEVNVRNEVAQILEANYDNNKKGIVAKVGVFDESFATNIRNRQALGILDGLACSIRAVGTTYAKQFEINDRKGRMVKEFTKVLSVDFVTAAGAGGKALSIEN